MSTLDNKSKVKMFGIFANMSSTGKFIVVFILIFVITFAWDKVDQGIDREEKKELYSIIAIQGQNVQTMVKEQQKVAELKVLIKEKLKAAKKEYDAMTDTLANVLNDAGLGIPDVLNKARMRYDYELEELKDSLIP